MRRLTVTPLNLSSNLGYAAVITQLRNSSRTVSQSLGYRLAPGCAAVPGAPRLAPLRARIPAGRRPFAVGAVRNQELEEVPFLARVRLSKQASSVYWRVRQNPVRMAFLGAICGFIARRADE